MTRSKQQKETLRYFRSKADEWQRMAEGRCDDKVNTIAQRNCCVKRICSRIKRIGHFLDIGCGTGELVLDLAASGVSSIGIDFAEEMITLCNKKKKTMGIDNATFIHGSIFDYEVEEDSAPYDLISAQGLIEYLNPTELDALLEKCHRLSAVDGTLVVGSRNRLFNLRSLNNYTAMEIELGAVGALMAEAMVFGKSATMKDSLLSLAAMEVELPMLDSHPDTGIQVATRHQYTPGQLARLLARHGFVADALFPVHYHAFLPRFAETHSMLHVDIADHVFEHDPDDPRLIPGTSTFVIAAHKA